LTEAVHTLLNHSKQGKEIRKEKIEEKVKGPRKPLEWKNKRKHKENPGTNDIQEKNSIAGLGSTEYPNSQVRIPIEGQG
jgi:hypothetical protein